MLPCPVFITMACTIYAVTYTMIQVTKAVFYAVDAKCTVPTWFVTPREIKKQRYYRKPGTGICCRNPLIPLGYGHS